MDWKKFYTSSNVGPEAYLLIHFLNYPGKKGYFDCTRCPKVEEFRKARSQTSTGSFHVFIVLQTKKKTLSEKKVNYSWPISSRSLKKHIWNPIKFG